MASLHSCDPLRFFWLLADAAEPKISHRIVQQWPTEIRATVERLGLLCKTENAATVLCPECHDHFEEVVLRELPDGSIRHFIHCPEHYRVEIEPEEMVQWTVSGTALAALLAHSFDLNGRCVPLVEQRLWRLGRLKWERLSRDVLFARGLSWPDGGDLRSAIVRAHKPIVVVPATVMTDSFWKTIPPQISLRDVAEFKSDRIDIEPADVAACIKEADINAAANQPIQLTRDDLKRTIRHQVKAESKSELTDAVYVAAYRQEGSYRAAADFLTEQTKQTVTKDKISRAVARAGGVAAVLDSTDSSSIVRGVSSQSRDKKGKNLIHSKG